MLIIKFGIRGAKITWFIHDNWAVFISFLLTLITVKAFKNILKSNKKIKIANSKGGAFIDDCIEPDSVYELVDPVLAIVVKQMLKLQPAAGPIIISTPLLILSYIVSRQPVKQVTILGVSLFVDEFKQLAVKTGIGILGGSIFLFVPTGVVSLTGVLLAVAIGVNVVSEIGDFKCENFVSKVSIERVSQEKTIGFLEAPPEKTPKIFIKGSEDTEIYVPSPDTHEFCSSEYKDEPQNQIRRKCEKKYVPLKKRTKTLADLKRDDSTENRKKAEPYIERYEKRRKRIMSERIK